MDTYIYGSDRLSSGTWILLISGRGWCFHYVERLRSFVLTSISVWELELNTGSWHLRELIVQAILGCFLYPPYFVTGVSAYVPVVSSIRAVCWRWIFPTFHLIFIVKGDCWYFAVRLRFYPSLRSCSSSQPVKTCIIQHKIVSWSEALV